LKMKSRPTIDASEEEPPFQANENENPLDLLDLDIEDNGDVENEQINDIRDVDDEEAVEINSSSDEADDEGNLQFHMNDLSDSDDDFSNDRVF